MTKLSQLILKVFLFIGINIFLTINAKGLPYPTTNVNIYQLGIFNEKISDFTSDEPIIIVIDPGHGGKDSGTKSGDIFEKDITLDVSLKVKKEIEKMIPEAIVYLTRDSDIFVPLNERIGFANRIKADLFISIHCNSYPDDHKISVVKFIYLELQIQEIN
ncbi:MAG: N-acetylmuramoyl-L-alanine amidase [Saprospiraceae bacterium]